MNSEKKRIDISSSRSYRKIPQDVSQVIYDDNKQHLWWWYCECSSYIAVKLIVNESGKRAEESGNKPALCLWDVICDIYNCRGEFDTRPPKNVSPHDEYTSIANILTGEPKSKIRYYFMFMTYMYFKQKTGEMYFHGLMILPEDEMNIVFLRKLISDLKAEKLQQFDVVNDAANIILSERS